jgi:DNA (cytosine-5)-methyltransferase 1
MTTIYYEDWRTATRRINPRILDLYCCAGAGADGYRRAGFDVVGVDIVPQKNYPFEFHQADALEYLAEHGAEFDAIHASPPCQAYTAMQHIHKNSAAHPDLIAPTRELLIKTGKPYVIENVVGAPMRVDFMLCGTMFGIPFPKHRWFEINWSLHTLLPPCNHYKVYDCFHGGEDARGEREKLSTMYGIDWFMTRQEIRNAIPPAYTKFIGEHLLQVLS